MEHNQIHFRAEFTIEEGKIEVYKKLVQEMSRVVEANEQDTLNYQFYLNRAELQCVVKETYTTQRLCLITLTALHHKQYFQGFLVSLG
ncbi:MAG: hypothetical protein DLM72_02790 [Candidatus Nitrosopolaris wilkensis]|nr:MAG: hypothetical protein DLM72_02790 [Candidatus Nitrosopolaris wilkensis]